MSNWKAKLIQQKNIGRNNIYIFQLLILSTLFVFNRGEKFVLYYELIFI